MSGKSLFFARVSQETPVFVALSFQNMANQFEAARLDTSPHFCPAEAMGMSAGATSPGLTGRTTRGRTTPGKKAKSTRRSAVHLGGLHVEGSPS